MLLVSDNTDDVVHRFNPTTGQSLGTIGAGLLVNPLGVTVDLVTNRAFILDGGFSVVVLDYSTGTFVRSFNVTSGASYMNRNSDGTLNFTYLATNRIERRTASGNLLQTYTNTSGQTIKQGIRLNDGFFYTGNLTTVAGARVQRFDYNSGTLLSTHPWASERMELMPGNGAFNVWTNIPGTNAVLEYNTFLAGPTSFQQTTSTFLTNAIGTAVGHSGICYAVGQKVGSPGVGIIQRYDANVNQLRGVFGDGLLNTPTGMAIVVAPEPGSLAAIAVGLAALATRRRKKEEAQS